MTVPAFILIIAGALCLWALAAAVAAVLPAKKRERSFTQELKAPMVIAHRGDSREFPENTMPSFLSARRAAPGCMLETDVWQTRDHAVVLSHDGELDVNTSGSGPIGSLDLEELINLDAGYNINHDGGKSCPFRGKSYRMATLDEALAAFPEALFSIDIKLQSRDFARRVMSLIESHGALTRVIIGSFHRDVLRFIRSEYPMVATSFSSREIIFFYALLRMRLVGFFRCGGDVFMVPEYSDTEQPEYLGENHKQGFRLVSRRFISHAHRAGCPVCLWTINREENMARLVRWGADGIITDYPGKLASMVAKVRAQR